MSTRESTPTVSRFPTDLERTLSRAHEHASAVLGLVHTLDRLRHERAFGCVPESLANDYVAGALELAARLLASEAVGAIEDAQNVAARKPTLSAVV